MNQWMNHSVNEQTKGQTELFFSYLNKQTNLLAMNHAFSGFTNPWLFKAVNCIYLSKTKVYLRKKIPKVYLNGDY